MIARLPYRRIVPLRVDGDICFEVDMAGSSHDELENAMMGSFILIKLQKRDKVDGKKILKCQVQNICRFLLCKNSPQQNQLNDNRGLLK